MQRKMSENTYLGYSAFSPGHKGSESHVHLLFGEGQKWMAATLVLLTSIA